MKTITNITLTLIIILTPFNTFSFDGTADGYDKGVQSCPLKELTEITNTMNIEIDADKMPNEGEEKAKCVGKIVVSAEFKEGSAVTPLELDESALTYSNWDHDVDNTTEKTWTTQFGTGTLVVTRPTSQNHDDIFMSVGASYSYGGRTLGTTGTDTEEWE